MSLQNFIPEVWSQQLLIALRKTHIWAQDMVVNRDYEGDIASLGDRVHVNSHSEVIVRDYDKQSTSGDGTDPQDNTGTQLVRQRLSSTRRTLVIDQAKYFNFEIDDVDQAQQSPKIMQEAMNDAAYQLADVADKHVAGKISDVQAANKLGTDSDPLGFSGNTGVEKAYDTLVDLATLLDEANVPQTGRWAIVPPWYRGLLRKDDRFVATGDGNAESARANGEVGEAAGFRIMVSNNTATGVHSTDQTWYAVTAGYRGACSHAEQIASVEAYRPEDAFSDAVKGLHLYGTKLIRPDGWAVAYTDRAKSPA